MASSPVTLTRRSTLALLPAITRLAWWRLKQMWRMLFVTWLGMIAMVVLVCSVPLFTQVSNTAGIRAALAAVPPSQQRITVNFASEHPTSAQLNQAQQQINQMLQSNLGAYLSGPAHFSVGLPFLTIQPTGPLASNSQNASVLAITGYQLDQVGSELTVLQGRLPAASSSQIEIALTQPEARSLKVEVGSMITASFPASVGQVTWTLRVVGIFATTQNWEYADTFQSQAGPSLDPNGPNSTAYPVLASSAALLPQISSLHVTLNDRQLFGRGGGVVKGIGGSGGPFFTLSWSYPFDISHVDANQLSSLLEGANNLSSNLPGNLQHMQNAAVFQQGPQGAVFSLLTEYSTDTTISAVPITALLILILSLVLFLVTTMSVALVERQTAVIATLRSRGATRRHVFGAFVAQGIGLGLLALVFGPFLALLLVDLLVHLLLPASALSSLNVLGSNPLLEALSVGWFALAAVICAVLAVIMAVRQATKMDVLAFRRESARATRRPFWRRLNLDIIGIVLLCLGYGGYLYLSQPVLAGQLGTGLLAIRGFMALVAPFLASAVCFTLFLRLYPLCLRLGSRLAARNRKAPPVLALAQMERAPRPASRIILLLSLIISTTMFILTYTATEQQRTIDAANFAVGADFSGPSAANPHHLT
ncbi:MAG TPA: FtsX-like permease family protein, partial [Ktedonobacterales bacterium]|nr:FtsX-like permease family protein [Ktedonobacterales bacterium]